LPLISLSAPMAAPNTTARMMLDKSAELIITLPFYKGFIDLYTEVPAGFFDVCEDFVAGL
jgi:hypothetical protein